MFHVVKEANSEGIHSANHGMVTILSGDQVVLCRPQLICPSILPDDYRRGQFYTIREKDDGI